MRTIKNLLKLSKLLYPHRFKLLVCMALIVAVNIAEIIKPIVLKRVIDTFLIQLQAQLGFDSITGMGVLYFLITLFGALCSVFSTRMINVVGQDMLHTLRTGLFSCINRLSIPNIDKYTTGNLITRITSDVETINEFYSDVFVYLFKDIVLIIGIVISMFSLNPRLALVALITVPLIFFITLAVRSIIRKNFIVMKKLIGQIYSAVSENIDGIRIVHAFNIERHKQREFNELNKLYYKSTLLQITMNSLLRPLMEVVGALGISILILVSFKDITAGLLELGVLYAFTTYVRQFFNPINDLAEKYNTIQSAMVSADRIYEIMDNGEFEDLEKGESLPSQKHLNRLDRVDKVDWTDSVDRIDRAAPKIEFRDVWFAYDNEYVLKGISFSIQNGESVAFVGPTGAGKTTIISLLSRFYDIQKGEIFIDGVPIQKIKLSELRKTVAVVLQDVFLFSGSVYDNISLGEDISKAKLEEAGSLSIAERFVSVLPEKYDSSVTERGATFSMGQRQLLSFARAIAHEPSILVLDEATANIDTNTELLIQKSIQNISKNRTTILIAHRLSTIRKCHRIFVVVDGVIAESGNHEELLKQEGHYAELCRIGFEDEE